MHRGPQAARTHDPAAFAGTVATGVFLYWLPLGAGGHCVRWSGRTYEVVVAAVGRRPRLDLYHSALEVRIDGRRFVVEQAPVGDGRGASRGVVAQGPVGARWAGRLRLFRYELRCWQDGEIADAAEAVDSPRHLTGNRERASEVLALAARVPTPIWGRDELHTGEMWNSNSIVAWLLASAGIDAGAIRPPAGGRAPGWAAGVTVARRDGNRGASAGRPS
ncbi:MAG: hypothetical protein U0R69_15455 [Gaiellales bacterium]